MYTLIFLFWIILNGKITVEIILLGIVFTASLGLLERYLFNYSIKKDLSYLKRVPYFIYYIYILIKEVIKANIEMMRIDIDESVKIDPILIKFHSGLKTSMGNFILANSITLTPGTITICTDGDEITVHCLREDMLDTTKNNVFIKLIKKMEDM